MLAVICVSVVGLWWLLYSSYFPFLICYFIYLFICGCFGSSLLHWLFSSCGKYGATPHFGAQASHYGCFFCCRAQALGHTGFSSCLSRALGHRLSRCVAWASLPCGMWGLPRSGIKPMSFIGRWILCHWATREALYFSWSRERRG